MITLHQKRRVSDLIKICAQKYTYKLHTTSRCTKCNVSTVYDFSIKCGRKRREMYSHSRSTVQPEQCAPCVTTPRGRWRHSWPSTIAHPHRHLPYIVHYKTHYGYLHYYITQQFFLFHFAFGIIHANISLLFNYKCKTILGVVI